MKSIRQKHHNSFPHYQRILALVILLLFLPLAQAVHASKHDNSLLAQINDVHCQICHSSIDTDGEITVHQLQFRLPANHNQGSATVTFNPLRVAAHHHPLIRAPPGDRNFI